MTEAFEELGGTIISIEEEKLSKEEMEELQRKKDKEQGRKPGKVEEGSNPEGQLADIDKRIAMQRLKRARVEKQQAKKNQGQNTEMQERTMTPGEKQKDTKLKKKYDDSDMKKNMQAQYGKEEGKKVYFATIRKQAMESSLNPFAPNPKTGKPDKGTPERAKEIAKNISSNRKSGPMKYDPYKGTDGRD